jgi:hypothetical protein
MMTNRQWLETLTDKQLALFFTFGLLVRSNHYNDEPFIISITQISMNYTASVAGIERWLSMPQDYKIVEGGEW